MYCRMLIISNWFDFRKRVPVYISVTLDCDMFYVHWDGANQINNIMQLLSKYYIEKVSSR